MVMVLGGTYSNRTASKIYILIYSGVKFLDPFNKLQLRNFTADVSFIISN